MKNVFAGEEPRLVPCLSNFSFEFDLIRSRWGAGSSTLNPLFRICCLMRKLGAACYVDETLGSFSEWEEECEEVSILCGKQVRGEACRLTFFRTMPSSANWRDVDPKDVLGYAVVVTLQLPRGDRRTYVLEAVLCVPTVWTAPSDPRSATVMANYYVHCSRPFQTNIGQERDSPLELSLNGTFFCQQNQLTHVCGHAALRTAINSSPIALPQGFAGSKLTNSEINRLLDIDHKARRVGSYDHPTKKGLLNGLLAVDIANVVGHRGFNVETADFAERPEVDYVDFIYPLVESGCPVILGVRRPDVAHVLSVLGHTINSDRWTPNARAAYGGLPMSTYVSTSAWVDHFVIADDNHGMYATLPTDSVRNFMVPKYNHELHAVLAIGLVPNQVVTSAYQAEIVATRTASQLIRGHWLVEGFEDGINPWLQKLERGLQGEGQLAPKEFLVCRTILQSRADYLAAMARAQDIRSNRLGMDDLKWMERSLPERFWVTELSVPQLTCGSKRKLGDIITDAGISPTDLPSTPAGSGTLGEPATAEEITRAAARRLFSGDPIMFAWLPGVAWNGKKLSGAARAWPLVGHIEVLRGAGAARPTLEW